MDQPGWRVVILTAVPEVATILNRSLRRLGHEAVAVVGARRRRPTPGLALLDATFTLPGVEVVIAPDTATVEPIVRSLRPDLMVSWAFPWRISPGALEVPGRGSINYHPSLLPRHRGPNPVAWTIRMGDSHYGVTWHRLDPEFDAGPILAQGSIPVNADDTNFDVIIRMSAMGLRMLPGVFERLAAGDPGDPQSSEGATEAGPFGDDYATIDWSMPASFVHNQVRAWSFTPGTHSVVGPIGQLNGRKVRVLRTSLHQPDADSARVECGDGPVWVLECEPIE
jgi:methionyl-tRNA formyltransferase